MKQHQQILFISLLYILFISSVSSLNNNIVNDNIFLDELDKQWYSLTSDFKVIPGKDVNDSLAWGWFKDELFLDGWGKLAVETRSSVSDESIAFKAAGYLEGYLTWKYIYNFSVNYFESNFNTSNVKEFPMGVVNFVSDNIDYMQTQIAANINSNDIYWNQVSNAFDQLNGVYEGYNTAISDPIYELSFLEIYLLNLYGDIGDIISATTGNNDEFKPMSRSDVEEYMATGGHCTALIKLTSNYSDLIVAHTTWADYSDMIRIYKRIIIPVSSTPNGYETLFASYPGLLVSIDDFYMIRPSKLMLTETLNSILNQTLYTLIKPQSLLYWVRNLVANRLSSNGFDWVYYYIQNNSGTNNIQFMVVDYKLFTPNQMPGPGLLWIVEQYPGGYEAADVTFSLLEHGYWGSFNRPYFLKVYDLLGYPYYSETYGSLFTYEYNPRANIFRRDQSSVESVEDIQSMILYNQYKTDIYSDGYPGNAISARYDIAATPMNPYSWFYHGTHGGIDGKAMNAAMFETYTVMAYNGPTVTSDCPPFSWSDWPDVSHIGMPDTFNFPWVNIKL
ncbi:phospholipase B-like protein [Heterostelium album PN500]|uniref:Phospholipase B-like n=1 Tax=Heterostelium pallidum (strain ATCC 26659 / Pp 5 / PN500) TaxID=670386 RepID=D3B6P3_HETP5|nr:phospholipase B-like protein [Heterostelium album PN500]EFA83013.1 phospholipase B-like protein [Heterostelium album PN500]|eukprot:XP_020435130.1 phospholipase B-like protein [Heterostelium album PN500]